MPGIRWSHFCENPSSEFTAVIMLTEFAG